MVKEERDKSFGQMTLVNYWTEKQFMINPFFNEQKICTLMLHVLHRAEELASPMFENNMMSMECMSIYCYDFMS